MRKTSWLIGSALGATLMLLGHASAQLPAAGQPPVIPETNVVAQPPETPVATQAPATGASILDNSVFASPPVDGYYAGESTTGTLLRVPDIGLPGTVNVIPRDVIRDQQVLNFTDLIRNIPGAAAGGDNLFKDALFIRGYLVESRDFRKNGMLDPTFTPRDFANVERVEIVQGPANVLYGAGSNSGLVNVITKKPMADSFSTGAITLGSWDQQRYTIDTNGMSQSGNLLYRVNAAYERTNSFRDFENVERTFVSPAVTWVIDSDTTLTWEGEFHEDRRISDRGLPASGPNAVGYPVGALALPPSRFVGEPANDGITYEDYRAALFLNHRINDQWSMNVMGSSLWYEFPQSSTFGLFAVSPTSVIRRRSDSTDQEMSHSIIANLAGEGDVLGFPHKVLFGTEQIYYDSKAVFRTSALNELPFNVVNPVYNNPTITPGTPTLFPVFRHVRHGYYMQDLVEVTDNLTVLSGVRFEDFDLTFQQNTAREELRFTDTIPRVGVVWQPLPVDVAFYANYSRSFSPPGGATFGAILPITGESWEGGIKAMLLENLAFTVCGFHSTLDNKPFRTLGFAIAQTANTRTQGLEVNLVGQITPRLSTVANYAYVDSYLTNGDIFNGQPERNVPANSANLWTRYNLVQNPDQTLGVALGMVCQDERLANLTGTFNLPGFTRWDAGVFHQSGNWFSQLYIENLFDKYYAQSSVDTFPVPGALVSVFPGAPVNARFQVGVTF